MEGDLDKLSLNNSLNFNGSTLEFLNNTAESIGASIDVSDWGNLLVGPYNQTESEEWQREYVRQYQLRHRNDPEVKYAVVIFYLIMVGAPPRKSLLTFCRSLWSKQPPGPSVEAEGMPSNLCNIDLECLHMRIEAARGQRKVGHNFQRCNPQMCRTVGPQFDGY